MRTCWKCGQVLADEIERCPECGNVSALESKPAASAKLPKPASARKELNPAEIAEKTWNNILQIYETKIVPVATHPWLWAVDQWLVRNWKWLALGAAVIAGLVAGAWELGQLRQHRASAKIVADQKLAAETASQVSELIQEVLPEKLEWGRTVMTRRVPGRFPDELSMEINKAKGELRFLNTQKTKALYTLLVTYHYRNAHQRTFVWEPVTFYFKKSGEHWVLTGDKWLSEWEVTFE